MSGLATTRAIERTGGHLYTLVEQGQRLGPFPGATALVTLQDSLGGSDGLMGWAVNLSLDAVEAALKRPNFDWQMVRQEAFAAKNGPRDLGSAIHIACDDLNRGRTLDRIGYDTAPYLAQYGAALFQKGIRILGSERYVVNTDIGFGGTYDSLVEIDGERGPLDVKSGKEKPSQRLQLTGLSMGQYHGEAGLEAEPMPELSGVGFILLLRPDGYELIRHEITQGDRDHFTRLVETYHQIREWAATYVAPSKGEPYAPTFIEEGAAA